MVGSRYKIRKVDLIFLKTNIILKEIIEEENKALIGQSEWRISLLKNVVYPEIREINNYASKGKIFFKYGKNQRMLESTYMMIDTFERIGKTKLGRHIFELQHIINSI